jgi:hypothetical protein
VDELRIYEAGADGDARGGRPGPSTLGPAPAHTDKHVGRSYRPVRGEASRAGAAEIVLDPADAAWLGDHRPTWTVPALPAMSMVDRLLEARPLPAALADVQVHRWLTLPGPTRTTVVPTEAGVALEAWRDAADARLSRFEPVCTGRFIDPGPRPEPWPVLDAPVVPDPYASGALFHGPAFQLLVELRRSADGASAVLDADAGSVPHGATHQGLLDALTHAIPHDAVSAWFPALADDQVAYPHRLPRLTVYGPAPTGRVRAEVRPLPLVDPRFPSVADQPRRAVRGRRVMAELDVERSACPRVPIGVASARRPACVPPRPLCADLRGSRCPRRADGVTATRRSHLAPATGCPAPWPRRTAPPIRAEIAAKDRVGWPRDPPEPGRGDRRQSSRRTLPLTRWPVDVVRSPGGALQATGAPALDLDAVTRVVGRAGSGSADGRSRTCTTG